eukprot:jgi/Mesvir1/28517/Mv13034-RA.2
MLVVNNEGAEILVMRKPDDDTGVNVTIPCGFVSLETGKAVYAALSAPFDPPEGGNAVAPRLWFSAPSQAFDSVAGFSSRGPTTDGRIKPEVVAPGVDVRSAQAAPRDGEGSCGLTKYSGTSMATPAVAGAAALVREYFEEGFHPSGYRMSGPPLAPSGPLVKAVLINGAAAMTGFLRGVALEPPPTVTQGFGRVALDSSLPLSSPGDEPPFRLYIEDGEVQMQTGEVRMLCLDIVGASGGEDGAALEGENGDPFKDDPYGRGISTDLRVTLVWHDYPSLTSVRRALVNDLDLAVIGPNGARTVGNTRLGTPGGTAYDRTNNVEKVWLRDVTPGRYRVEVRAFAVRQSVPGGVGQPYALVASGRRLQKAEECVSVSILSAPPHVSPSRSAVFRVALSDARATLLCRLAPLATSWAPCGVVVSSGDASGGSGGSSPDTGGVSSSSSSVILRVTYDSLLTDGVEYTLTTVAVYREGTATRVASNEDVHVFLVDVTPPTTSLDASVQGGGTDIGGGGGGTAVPVISERSAAFTFKGADGSNSTNTTSSSSGGSAAPWVSFQCSLLVPEMYTSSSAAVTATGATFVNLTPQSSGGGGKDEASWTPCTSPVALFGLLDGTYTFRVRAVDRAGNVDPDPTSFSWEVQGGAGSPPVPRLRLLGVVDQPLVAGDESDETFPPALNTTLSPASDGWWHVRSLLAAAHFDAAWQWGLPELDEGPKPTVVSVACALDSWAPLANGTWAWAPLAELAGEGDLAAGDAQTKPGAVTTPPGSVIAPSVAVPIPMATGSPAPSEPSQVMNTVTATSNQATSTVMSGQAASRVTSSPADEASEATKEQYQGQATPATNLRGRRLQATGTWADDDPPGGHTWACVPPSQGAPGRFSLQAPRAGAYRVVVTAQLLPFSATTPAQNASADPPTDNNNNNATAPGEGPVLGEGAAPGQTLGQGADPRAGGPSGSTGAPLMAAFVALLALDTRAPLLRVTRTPGASTSSSLPTFAWDVLGPAAAAGSPTVPAGSSEEDAASDAALASAEAMLGLDPLASVTTQCQLARLVVPWAVAVGGGEGGWNNGSLYTLAFVARDERGPDVDLGAGAPGHVPANLGEVVETVFPCESPHSLLGLADAEYLFNVTVADASGNRVAGRGETFQVDQGGPTVVILAAKVVDSDGSAGDTLDNNGSTGNRSSGGDGSAADSAVGPRWAAAVGNNNANAATGNGDANGTNSVKDSDYDYSSYNSYNDSKDSDSAAALPSTVAASPWGVRVIFGAIDGTNGGGAARFGCCVRQVLPPDGSGSERQVAANYSLLGWGDAPRMWASDSGVGDVANHSTTASCWVECASPLTLRGLTPGEYVLRVSTEDYAGNRAESPASYRWHFRGEGEPYMAITSPLSPPRNASSLLSISFKAREAPDGALLGDGGGLVANASFQCQLRGVSLTSAQGELGTHGWRPCSSPTGYAGGDLAEGSFLFSVTPQQGGSDEASLTAASASLAFQVDKTPPAMRWLRVSAQPPTHTSTGGSSNSFPILVDFGCRQSLEPLPCAFVCSVDGAREERCSAPVTLSVASGGIHAVAVAAEDAAGNRGAPIVAMWDDSNVPWKGVISMEPANEDTTGGSGLHGWKLLLVICGASAVGAILIAAFALVSWKRRQARRREGKQLNAGLPCGTTAAILHARAASGTVPSSSEIYPASPSLDAINSGTVHVHLAGPAGMMPDRTQQDRYTSYSASCDPSSEEPALAPSAPPHPAPAIVSAWTAERVDVHSHPSGEFLGLNEVAECIGGQGPPQGGGQVPWAVPHGTIRDGGISLVRSDQASAGLAGASTAVAYHGGQQAGQSSYPGEVHTTGPRSMPVLHGGPSAGHKVEDASLGRPGLTGRGSSRALGRACCPVCAKQFENLVALNVHLDWAHSS